MQQSPWVIVTGDFSLKGGMDRANFALADYVASQGVRVFLVTHFADSALKANPLVTLHLVPRPAGSVTLSSPLLDYAGRSLARKVQSRWPAAKVVSNGASCIWPGINWAHYIHHAWHPAAQTESLLRNGSAKLIQSFHRNREKAAYQKAKLILCNSNLTRAHLLQHFSVDPSRIRTLYLGSDPDFRPITLGERNAARSSLGIQSSRKIALFVGAIGRDRRKGIDTLVKAWKILCGDAGWDMDLLVAGAGDTDVLASEVARLGLQNRLRILGFSENVHQLLAAADLLVSPTRYEAYGLNVQEAICRGLTAMVSASSGIAERYPRDLEAMLIADPDDAIALANKLLQWRKCAQQWSLRFAPLGDVLRNYTWNDMAREFVALAETSNAEPRRAA
jgi:glycosyltransferase involved in cell wall biosynthesis